ncbi:MAG: hypothetical protein NZ873_01645 [Crenarchaeota archaeon]|nr:hypothetical protein [Thermoproteota archaeon]MDW8034166.1 hypothetical protein [Nitrososphaerota archaeon]
MVEGPTAKAYAIKINKEFFGETVKNIFIKSKKVFIPSAEILGKSFSNADSIGKNILLFFDDVAIRVHLMLFGSIHIYGINEDLQKPKKQVRVIVEGARKKIVIYNAPIVEIDKKDEILRRLRSELGPDPLNSEWDEERAIQNILKFPNEKIGVVLLNQSVIAGIGNILRNEDLFRARINPERIVGKLSEEETRRVVRICKELSEEFLKLKIRGVRIGPILYVYNKYGKKCNDCGNGIRFYFQEPIRRKTFVCGKCQK